MCAAVIDQHGVTQARGELARPREPGTEPRLGPTCAAQVHDEIKAEFIAIFDADFLPEPGFLMRAIPFFQDKKVRPAQDKTCTPCPCAHDLAAACHRVQPLTSQL